MHNWTSLEDKWLAYKKHLVQVITYENNLPHAHNTNSFDLIVHFVNQYSKQNIYLFQVCMMDASYLITFKSEKVENHIMLPLHFRSNTWFLSIIESSNMPNKYVKLFALKIQGIGKMKICPKTHICYNMGVSLRSNLDIKPYSFMQICFDYTIHK